MHYVACYLYVRYYERDMVLSLAYAWCNVPVMPLRSEPSHRAEQISQVLFGERVEIWETDKDWMHIHNLWDGYEGWCKQSQLVTISRKEFRKDIKYNSASHNDRIMLPSGPMWLPLGADLFGYKGGKMKLQGEDAGKYKGKKLKIRSLELTGEALKAAAMNYLNAPYQWGGKTVLGIDCSGLTQMAFKLCNHKIPRDASQQANEGTLVDFLQHARCGDLAFFDNKEGKIVHVGILLDGQTIIHATDTAGKVVIDRIDQAGIISTSLKMRTHNLRFVKRLIP